ncbi:2091_t:CDS:2, partial [Funneliformis geosporum]
TELLISRKDNIDDKLESRRMYAIRIDFQKESTRPFIAYWVDEPLDIQILECIETIFEDQFEAIYQVISLEDSEDNDNEYYDITIEAGEDPNDNDDVLTHIKLPNILPETLQIILK